MECEEETSMLDASSVYVPSIDAIEIYVDYRESKLINELNLLLPSRTKTKNLELGDILIVSTGTHEFTLIFERKAGSDLDSSIKDRRYSEQKTRILSMYTPSKCTYIIEGLKGYGENPNYILNSALIHTMYRDNMHVVHTNTVKATAAFIKDVYERCIAHPEYFCDKDPESSSNNHYISNMKIKSRKIDNIDPSTCYILQLCQVPGISHIIASEIVAVYPTLGSLVDALRTCNNDAEKIKLLKRINMIADKKAAKLAAYIQV